MFPDMKQQLLELVIWRDGLFGVVGEVEGAGFIPNEFYKILQILNPSQLMIVHE